MKKSFKIVLICLTALIGIVFLFVSAIALKVFVIGEVKNISTLHVKNISVTESEVEFDIVTSSSADIFKDYSYRTQGDKMYIKIHTVLAGGIGSKPFDRHLVIKEDLAPIHQILVEDNIDNRVIWERQERILDEREAENKETENDNPKDSQTTAEVTAPTKEEVLAAREQALEGMSEEEAERLKENIKVANLRMESAYLYDDIFAKLEDAESFYWNYFDETGEIQTGWSYGGDFREMREIMEKENLSADEFYSQYGTPVIAYNRFDAENFMELLDEMKQTVQNEKLKGDLQQLIDETELAAQTHEMEHAYNIYQLLHDMDYYLLRYGPEDVGKYVQDTSTIAKYYGVLSVYDEMRRRK